MNKNLFRTLQSKEFGKSGRIDLVFQYAHFAGYEPSYVLTVTYLECTSDEDGSYHWNAYNSEYFPVESLDRAIEAFDLRASSSNPAQDSGLGHNLKDFLHIDLEVL